MIWKPNVTVAAVIERRGSFLLVEEHTAKGPRFNQPAGHLEPGESLLAAVARETLEETAHRFVPEALIGIYRWHHAGNGATYLRFAFSGRAGRRDPKRPLDEGIIRAVWMTPQQIRAQADRHRSVLVQRCMDDYLSGTRYPLQILTDYH